MCQTEAYSLKKTFNNYHFDPYILKMFLKCSTISMLDNTKGILIEINL